MNEINLKRLSHLVGYGKLVESEEYPIDFTTPASSGDAADHNQTNAMGDNPMKDPSVMEDQDITPIMLSKLNHVLNGIGVQDSDIAMGDIQLSDKAIRNIISSITGESENAQHLFDRMIQLLSDRLMGNEPEENLNEFMDIPNGSRFSYVLDSLGSVTVYDGDEGTAINLQGSDALELIHELQQVEGDDAAVQDVLAQYQHVMETQEETQQEEVIEAAPTGTEVNELQARLLSIAIELKDIMNNATATPANNVHDWSRQNQLEIELEPIVEQLEKAIANLSN